MCTFSVFQLFNLCCNDYPSLKYLGLALPTPTILGWERPEFSALRAERPDFTFVFYTKRSPPVGRFPEVCCVATY